MHLASDVLMLLASESKKTDEIYEELRLDLGYYLSTPHPAMDIILKISKEKIGLITYVDYHLFLEKSMWEDMFFAVLVSWKVSRLDKAPVKSSMRLF